MRFGLGTVFAEWDRQNRWYRARERKADTRANVRLDIATGADMAVKEQGIASRFVKRLL